MRITMKMNLFVIMLIFCSALEFSAQIEFKRLSLSLRKTMLLQKEESSEYIPRDKRATLTAKFDHSYSPRNVKRVQIFRTRNATKLMKRIWSLEVTRRGKTVFPSSSMDSSTTNSIENYETLNNYHEKADLGIHSKTLDIHTEASRTLNSRKKSRSRISNLNKSETFYSDPVLSNINKSTDIENSTRLLDVSENENANNFSLPYRHDNTSHLNGEISGGMPLNLEDKMTSSKDPASNLSYPTSYPSQSTFSSEFFLNNSETSARSSSTETSGVSSAVYPSPAPKSRVKKTVVAAIVAAINGIIGFSGAAVFTCLKYKYLQSEERRPLIN